MRPVIFLASVFALSALAGCTASTENQDADSTDDALTSRPQLELKSTSDKSSVQAKLYALMSAFEHDAELGISSGIESPAFFMKGAKEKRIPLRSIECSQSHLVHATIGVGVTNTAFSECTLIGFDKNRAGGSLPVVFLPSSGEEALAGKLFGLLEKGAAKGGLGVKRTTPNTPPPCCDIPQTTTFEISNSAASLSCTLHSGGFAAIQRAECTYATKDTASDEVLVEKGELVRTFGIGGENTGMSAKLDDGSTVELVLDAKTAKTFVAGRVARITGTQTLLSGVETHGRKALKVQNLLVCPAAKSPVDMMPPVSDDTSWIVKNCPDLGEITQ